MYDIRPMGTGVELTSPSLQGYVAGISKLQEDNYNIDYRTAMQKGILMMLYANKNPVTASEVSKENQKLIELNSRIFELEEELAELKDTGKKDNSKENKTKKK